MNEREIRVRFAPSPTGYLHIGGARTALFNYFFARRYGGKFILRIEDTDKERSTPVAIENMIDSLKWLGIEWDEGPYFQSKRIEIYKKYVNKLLKEKKAYYCFCTDNELEEKKKRMLALKKPPIYDGRCRNLSEEEVKKHFERGHKASIRFKVEPNKEIKFNDLVRGKVKFNSNLIGDFIIFKSDGTPSYNFAVVIDDHLMKITHIIRGEEHISNTPRQILIYNALGFSVPEFAHISLILGKNRLKLSKRDNSTSLLYLKERGFLPQAVINYLALLGWSHPDKCEILSKEKIIKSFTIERLGKSPAIYDFEKLKWFNGKYIRNLCSDELLKISIPFIIKSNLATEKEIEKNYERFKLMVESIRDNLTLLEDVPENLKFYFKSPTKVEKIDEKILKDFLMALKNLKNFNLEEIRNLLRNLSKKYSDKKMFYHNLRIALTGRESGPPLDYIILIYGKEKILNLNYR